MDRNEHPELKGIMSAICLEPRDHGLRAVLADWYEDNGRPLSSAFLRADLECWRLLERADALPDCTCEPPSGASCYRCREGIRQGLWGALHWAHDRAWSLWLELTQAAWPDRPVTFVFAGRTYSWTAAKQQNWDSHESLSKMNKAYSHRVLYRGGLPSVAQVSSLEYWPLDGPGLVGACPIIEVRTFLPGVGHHFVRLPDGGAIGDPSCGYPPGAQLPAPIFDLLRGWDEEDKSSLGWSRRKYHTARQAWKACTAAMLNWARLEAGHRRRSGAGVTQPP